MDKIQKYRKLDIYFQNTDHIAIYNIRRPFIQSWRQGLFFIVKTAKENVDRISETPEDNPFSAFKKETYS